MFDLFEIYLLIGLAVALAAFIDDEDEPSGGFFLGVFFFWPFLIALAIVLWIWTKFKR